MDSTSTDYRQKWRIKRRQRWVRKVPLAGAAAVVVLGIVALSAWERKPQLGAVAWAHGDGSRGLPRLGLGAGHLVVAWERGAITAHSPATGMSMWDDPFQRSREFVAPPAVGEDCVVFGAMDGFVKCLELDTGEVRWGYDAAGLVRSTPLIADGRVYVGSDDGHVTALPLDDGDWDWVYPGPGRAGLGPILGGPAVEGDTLVCGASDRTIFGLDIATGEERWRRRIETAVMARATTQDGYAYFAGETGLAVCVKVDSGETVWSRRVPGLIRFPILPSGLAAYVATSTGIIEKLDAKTGEVKWRLELGGRPTTSMVAGPSSVYIGTSDGVVRALDVGTGKTTWRWRPGSKPMGDLLLGGGKLYCAAESGRVFAVRIGE